MRHLAAVVLLFSLACGDGQSPVQPTPSSPCERSQEFSLSGSAMDTASRPLGGATVEVIAGSSAGMVTITDDKRPILDAGTFTGTVTLRASKDGYVPETTTVPPNLPPNRPLPPLLPGGSETAGTCRSLLRRTVSRQTSRDCTL